jgi:hypothetical protein
MNFKSTKIGSNRKSNYPNQLNPKNRQNNKKLLRKLKEKTTKTLFKLMIDGFLF